jgi:ubiquinone/menaquinone biosynthesis C-methylase UbiE
MEVIIGEHFLNSLKSDFIAVNGITSKEDKHEVYFDKNHYYGMLKELENAVDGFKNKKVLEIGSGYGMLSAIANKEFNYDFYGIEPTKVEAEGRFEQSQILFNENNIEKTKITAGFGESLPFDDESFNVVFSFQVLEHVQDPYKVLSESWRVLKKGGQLYINAPNYNFFFEGHYHVLWLPNMPKWLAKIYLKILGKNTEYLNHLNFLTERKLKKWLLEITDKNKIESDFGFEDWKNRMKNANMNKHLPKNAKKLYNIVDRLGMINFLISLGKYFRWQDCLRVAIVK